MKILIVSISILIYLAFPEMASAKCVQIYYDKPASDAQGGEYGRHLAGFLQNLIGHFPKIAQKVARIQKYKAGQIESCDATIYMSSEEGMKVPKAFIKDFANTEKSVAWVGYNVDQLGADQLKDLWGVKYAGLGKLDDASEKASEEEPGFFKFYDYKGETFFKRGQFDDDGKYEVDFDVALLDFISDDDGDNDRKFGDDPEPDPKDYVVSWMRHSTSGEKRPYILRNENHWLVGDIPFSYVHEEDRYLIFADVLFDILGEKAQNDGPLPALVRYEDVSANTPLRQIKAVMSAAENTDTNYAISLIPIYRNLDQTIKMTDKPEFVDLLKQAQKNGGSIIMHGVTHQSDDFKNPSGESGTDYEFWDVVNNKPMKNDSSKYVINRLEQGFAELDAAGIKPLGWLCPHYGASPTDNLVFAQMFHWNIGRVMYAPFNKTQTERLPDNLTFDNSSSDQNGEREAYFDDLKVQTAKSITPEGQFFPYEIYKDRYGQHIIPENIGYIRPTDEGPYEPINLVDDMLRMLKRNKVLRDVWGSLYIHPYIVDTADQGGIGEHNGDTSEIERLYKSAKQLGYQFVDLKSYTHPDDK